MHRSEHPMDGYLRADEFVDVMESFDDVKEETSINGNLMQSISFDTVVENRTV